MRIPSGTTDQYLYFVAVDPGDFTTRETSLTSVTVYRARNGAAAAAMTTPTVAAVDATNMPGVFSLLLDEDMTIAAGNTEEEMVFHIAATEMADVTRSITLYRPIVTEGNTLDVTSTGAAGIDWGNIENPSSSVNLSATTAGFVNRLNANAIISSSFSSGSILSGAFGSNAITASVLATDAATEIADAVATRQIDNAINADGTMPTLQQAVYHALQRLTESNTAGGTTLTVYAVDGTTSLGTYTLNNATNPTSITRAT